MSDVVAAIEARLAEIEAAAKAATPGPWYVDNWGDLRTEGPTTRSLNGDQLIGGGYDDGAFYAQTDADHAALNDPAAVLRMVENLRTVVARCRLILDSWDRVHDRRADQAAFPDVNRRERSHARATLDDIAAAVGAAAGSGDGGSEKGDAK